MGFKFLLSLSTIFSKSRCRASSVLNEKYLLVYVSRTDGVMLLKFSYAGVMPANFSANAST